MNRTQILFISGVILFVGLINAWVLNVGFKMLQFKSFSSSLSPSPAVAALPGNRFVIIDREKVNIYRIDGEGKITPESFSRKAYGDDFYRSFEPFPTPVPNPTAYYNQKQY